MSDRYLCCNEMDEDNRVKQGIRCAGKQAGDSVWVINIFLQIDKDGKPQTDKKYSWQPIGGPCIELAGKGNFVTYS